jgi:hypothetical protein
LERLRRTLGYLFLPSLLPAFFVGILWGCACILWGCVVKVLKLVTGRW